MSTSNIRILIGAWLLCFFVLGCVSKNEGARSDTNTQTPGLNGGTVMTSGTLGGNGQDQTPSAGTQEGTGGANMAGGAAGDTESGGVESGGSVGSEGPSCDETCLKIEMCIATECSDASEGYREAMAHECARACQRDNEFVNRAQRPDTCPDLIEFLAENAGVSLQNTCTPDPKRRPLTHDCVQFAEGYAQCLIERCPAGESIRDIVQNATAQFCAEASGSGNFDAQASARIYGPGADCSGQIISSWFDRLLVFMPQDISTGHLAKFCGDGPLNSQEICRQACLQVERCVPVDSPFTSFRNSDRCMELCLTREAPPESVWRCRADANDCDTFAACTEDIQAPQCESMAANAAQCIASRCEPAAEVTGVFAGFLSNLCESQIASGQIQPIVLEHPTARDSCDEGLASVYARFLTERIDGQDGSGSLIPFCRSGPGLEPEVCQRACEFVGPCIPEDNPAAGLKDQVTCEFICLTNQDISVQTWECLSSANRCIEVGSCFN